jgi:hypothetical protein
MNVALSPIESEFSSVNEAEEYARWFRAKVQVSLVDDSPLLPHDEVMAEMQNIIDENFVRHASRSVAR